MIQSFRKLQSIRLEPEGNEFVLVLTATLGSEMVVERLPLGEIEREDLMAALESALVELRSPMNLQSAA